MTFDGILYVQSVSETLSSVASSSCARSVARFEYNVRKRRSRRSGGTKCRRVQPRIPKGSWKSGESNPEVRRSCGRRASCPCVSRPFRSQRKDNGDGQRRVRRSHRQVERSCAAVQVHQSSSDSSTVGPAGSFCGAGQQSFSSDDA
jgi:hypothetical protein